MMLIPLGNKRGLQLYAKVDDSDFERFICYKWHLSSGYASRIESRIGGKRKIIWMHKEVLCLSSTGIGDHINGDRLDNRRENLRPCTKAENAYNKGHSRRVGVRKFINGTWEAWIGFNGEDIHLGYFKNQANAIIARMAAEIKYYKDFRRKPIPPRKKELANDRELAND